MEHPLPFPQLPSCCLSASSDFILVAVLTQATSIPSIHPQCSEMDAMNWNQGCSLNFPLSWTFCLLMLLFLKPSSSHSTQLSQNSQTPGCILGMPRKLLIFPEQELMNKDMTFPQHFSRLWLPWQRRVYPPWRVNRVRQPRDEYVMETSSPAKRS